MKMYENLDYFLNNNNFSFTLKKVTLYRILYYKYGQMKTVENEVAHKHFVKSRLFVKSIF